MTDPYAAVRDQESKIAEAVRLTYPALPEVNKPTLPSRAKLILIESSSDYATEVTSEEYVEVLEENALPTSNMKYATASEVIGPLRLSLRANHVLLSAFGGSNNEISLRDGSIPTAWSALMLDETSFIFALGARGHLEVFHFEVDMSDHFHSLTKHQGVVTDIESSSPLYKLHFLDAGTLVALTSDGQVLQLKVQVEPDLRLGRDRNKASVWWSSVKGMWSVLHQAEPPKVVLSAFSASKKCLVTGDSSGVVRIHNLLVPGASQSCATGARFLPLPPESRAHAVAINIAADVHAAWLFAVSFSDGSHKFYSVDNGCTSVSLCDELPASANVSHVTHAVMSEKSILCYDPVQSCIEISHFTVPYFYDVPEPCRIVTTIRTHVPYNSVVCRSDDLESFILFGQMEWCRLRIRTSPEILLHLIGRGLIPLGGAKDASQQLAQCLGDSKATSIILNAADEVSTEAERNIVGAMFKARCPPRADGLTVHFSGAVAAAKTRVDALVQRFGIRRLDSLGSEHLVELRALMHELLRSEATLRHLFGMAGWLDASNLVSAAGELLRSSLTWRELTVVLPVDAHFSFSDACLLQILYTRVVVDGLRRAHNICGALAIFIEADIPWPARREDAGLHLTLPNAAWHADSTRHLTVLFHELVDRASSKQQLAHVLGQANTLLREALLPFEQVELDGLLLVASGNYDGCMKLLEHQMGEFLARPLRHLQRVLDRLQAAEPSSLFQLKGYLMALKCSATVLASSELSQSLQQILFQCIAAIEADDSKQELLDQATELLLANSGFPRIGQVVAEWVLSHTLDHPRIRQMASIFAQIVAPPACYLCSAAQAVDAKTQTAAYCTLMRSIAMEQWTPLLALELLELASTKAHPMHLSVRHMVATDAIPDNIPEEFISTELLSQHEAVLNMISLQTELLEVVAASPESSAVEVRHEVSTELLSTERFIEICDQFKQGAPLQLKMIQFLSARRDPILQQVTVEYLCRVIVAALVAVAETKGVEQACREIVAQNYAEYGGHFPLLETISVVASQPRKQSTEELLMSSGVEPQALFEAYLACLDEEWVMQNTEPSLKPLNVLRSIEQVLLALPDTDQRHRCANDVKERVHVLRGYVKEVRDNLGEIDRILEAVSRQDGVFLTRQDTTSF